MDDNLYEIGQDMGDDLQLSLIDMYRDRLPYLHRIAEIDDEVSRGISRWVGEEDLRDSGTYVNPLDEPDPFVGPDEWNR
ncbi:hypothetical protein E1295_24860 [Nonomuraea mesophila]|uniref:Uncharacterized protein n=1 Tax=Nonomuraea mesophila TaxID=2530382 RepID=A0A4R5F8X1_9ACTN|nr:hypothetical protein [Nonomuraea mesophila]TDE44657.1 hypothetical protein E1295_24860 [Nonomuraea mesophila]